MALVQIQKISKKKGDKHKLIEVYAIILTKISKFLVLHGKT